MIYLKTMVIFCKSTSITEASGWADSPQLSRLRSVAMTLQDWGAFTVFSWYTADLMREVSCPRSARPSGKMRCCCLISTDENYIVFDAKLTRLNHIKKHHNSTYSCFLKQSKFWKSTKNISGHRQCWRRYCQHALVSSK